MGQFFFQHPGTTATTFAATASGGNTIPLPALKGRTIQLVTYNTLTLIPETNPPDAQGWYYDNNPASPTYGDLILGIPVNQNDVLQILFQ